MIRRLYVEKRRGLDHEAQSLLRSLKESLPLDGLRSLRVVNRYDVEGLNREEFHDAALTVFSEPPVDRASGSLRLRAGQRVLAVEYLPGQFDQRADSAAQCVQMRTLGERPLVRTARLYVFSGSLDDGAFEDVKRFLINPVEAREASLEKPKTLRPQVTQPPAPPILAGFRAMDGRGMDAFLKAHALSMGADDLQVCVDYFAREGRDPSLTEMKVLDTYWSDHCRHTTFQTEIDAVACDDPLVSGTLKQYLDVRKELGRGEKPVTLMDLATAVGAYLKRQGRLPELDESEEINACAIRARAETARGPEDWVVFFKNETHNHPTEIEPFGGAATCIGGAIRDPLSARAYVYAGMRVTGSADPTAPLSETLPGKLPQRLISTGAAAGFSSYGNQIGVATGCVKEFYHPGYAAKRLECGAVLGAAKACHIRRERPAPGDAVILVGGRTGRDGCGGASGSSMSHTVESVATGAAQVQKGNAPEERKLQRLFLRPEATALVKRCNDFGAGGVSVAIGELAPGLDIDLDRVPVKYEGLSGTELAISESQERMAVVCAAADAERFIALAGEENLEATVMAAVTQSPRLVMRHRGAVIVDLSRAFIDRHGARKHASVRITPPAYRRERPAPGFAQSLLAMAGDLNVCSQRGLVERFDSTIGAATVLFPLGGAHRRTPPSAMVHRLPVPGGTGSASYMSFGFNPFISEKSPYHGGYLAVAESVSRLVAAGAPFEAVYLSLQEYFPSPMDDPERWGLPMAALLGAFRAQTELGCAAIGGKDSMSGTFEGLDVPPTLLSFAMTVAGEARAVSPELKGAGRDLCWLRPAYGPDGLPEAESLRETFRAVSRLLSEKKAVSCLTPGWGGALQGLTQMAAGNGVGVDINGEVPLEELAADAYGSFILEMAVGASAGTPLGRTVEAPSLSYRGESVALAALHALADGKLASVFPETTAEKREAIPTITHRHAKPARGPRFARPRVLIPALPGTNCELDTARAFEKAGCAPEVFLVKNLTSRAVEESVRALAARIRNAQILFIPGGFSGGDEPDGSGKFITALFGNPAVIDALEELLHTRRGLAGGICNGFQALVKMGLLPSGRFTRPGADSPTLAHNKIGRHQSRLVTVRVASTLSPWFGRYTAGECRSIPVSHGEGRFLCTKAQAEALAAAGQIAAQYADGAGKPSMDIRHNPSGSFWAVEALTSPDGRVMGRMGHAERMLDGLYRNVPTTGEDPLFLAAADYFA